MFILKIRSRTKHLDQDVYQGLALVQFRRSLNVSLTRVMAMMVIVDSSELLVFNDHWTDYLHFCFRNDAYSG
ncbi:MAG: hypothetical protein J3Q66DRAFT_338105 [Benniella sp.]|nr:MAG: hypothetical protein J3Q66DRAFT_338105 [Benniella sp.]